jgi:hypothetical protein
LAAPPAIFAGSLVASPVFFVASTTPPSLSAAPVIPGLNINMMADAAMSFS